MERLFKNATDSQRKAISHLDGPLLVLAGPGSGKTRVVTHRIAWLVEQGVPPESILAITFTNKAAEEMRERVGKLVDARGAWISTFHAMGARMLRRHGDRIGIDPKFTIYSDDDQQRIVKDVMREMSLSTNEIRPAAVLAGISRLKMDLVPPDRAESRANDLLSRITAKVYPGYERRLRESSGLDFDDLIVKTLKLLRESEEAREHYRRRFQFILVDEYQDTNQAQFLLLRELSDGRRNLHVTGDPDQAIYGFRGADIRNILEFESQYQEAKVVRLQENFRSTGHILKAADSLIQRNRDRKAKSLVATREAGRRLRVHAAADEEEEGRIIAAILAGARERGIPWSETAVLYRVHSLSRSIERGLIDRGIPYTIVRGTEFFRRAEVLDLLAYLKVVANPRDSETLERVLNVPARGIGATSRDRLAAYARAEGIPLLTAAGRAREVAGLGSRGAASVESLFRVFAELAPLADGSVAELLGAVIRIVGYEDHLKKTYPDNWEERWENVGQLVSSAAEFEAKHEGAGLLAYLEEVSLLSDADAGDGASDRVSLMSLHTAKGLEFRTVVIAGLEEGLLPHSRSAESRAELEEERRLLFVGMTRAKEELHLTYARERFRWGEHGASLRSAFLAELDPDAVEGDEAPSAAFGGIRESHYEVDEWVEPSPDDEIRTGMRVRHGRFGVGRVKEISGRGPSARVLVDFLAHGEKRLVLAYARLVPVEETPW